MTAESLASGESDRRRSLLLTAGGHVLRESGRALDAESVYRDAVKASPDNPDAHLSLGNLLVEQGREGEALATYTDVARLRQFPRQISDLLVRVLHSRGRSAEATELLEHWLTYDPDNPTGLHMLAAAGIGDPPDRASDDYLRETFDSFSNTFDEVLARLDYQGHQLVASAILDVAEDSARDLVVLDAGCGTGLAGPLLAPLARRLVGVDVSPGMLERAAEHETYDELIEAELTAHLDDHPETYDLIGSADVLTYFGALEDLIAAAHRALRPSGNFVFSVESTADVTALFGFALEQHGRFVHSRSYLDRVATGAGFEVIRMADAVIRHEAGEPVVGLVVSLRKPDRLP